MIMSRNSLFMYNSCLLYIYFGVTDCGANITCFIWFNAIDVFKSSKSHLYLKERDKKMEF